MLFLHLPDAKRVFSVVNKLDKHVCIMYICTSNRFMRIFIINAFLCKWLFKANQRLKQIQKVPHPLIQPLSRQKKSQFKGGVDGKILPHHCIYVSFRAWPLETWDKATILLYKVVVVL